MKKLLTLAMAVVMVLAMSAPVFAAELSGSDESGTVDVTYGVAQGYQVTIPENFDLQVGQDVEKSVSAQNVLIPEGNTLKVAMQSLNNLAVVYKGSSIAYTVKVGEAAFTNGENVLSLVSGNTSGSAALKFTTTSAQVAAATKAGDHTDTLTFTCSVE